MSAVLEKSLKPTRKWWVAFVTGAVGLALMLLTGDSTITDPEKVAIGSFLTAQFAAWLLPNEATASGDGVPIK